MLRNVRASHNHKSSTLFMGALVTDHSVCSNKLGMLISCMAMDSS